MHRCRRPVFPGSRSAKGKFGEAGLSGHIDIVIPVNRNARACIGLAAAQVSRIQQRASGRDSVPRRKRPEFRRRMLVAPQTCSGKSRRLSQSGYIRIARGVDGNAEALVGIAAAKEGRIDKAAARRH